MIHRRIIDRTIHLLACAAIALSIIPQAHAQPFPNKPITIIVPFGAGGPTDIVARVIAERLTATLGQRVIVENAAGAAGITGAARAARSAPDGYTLLMGPMSTMSFSPTLYPNAPVHTLKDFEPVGIVASAPIVIVGSKEIPGNTLKEFMASAKKKAKLSNGNAGAGTTSHLACVMLNARSGLDPAAVPAMPSSTLATIRGSSASRESATASSSNIAARSRSCRAAIRPRLRSDAAALRLSPSSRHSTSAFSRSALARSTSPRARATFPWLSSTKATPWVSSILSHSVRASACSAAASSRSPCS